MSRDDDEVGALVIGADRNWQKAGWLEMLAVRLLASRTEMRHLGLVFVIASLRGRPYLLSAREGG